MCAARWLVCITALIVSAAAECGAISRATARLPEVPAPPQASVQWIARSMRLNGLPMTLQAFESALPPEAALSHYARWWSTRADARGVSRIARRDDWQILSLTSQQVHITVRARSVGNGSEGSVAVSRNPTAIKPSTATSFPHPRSARTVNLQEYEDPAAMAEHISMISPRSVAIEANDFTALLTRKGWSVHRSRKAQALERGHVLEAQKGSHLAQLTFQPRAHSGSTIIVIWRKG